MKAAAGLLLLACGCNHDAPVTSCADSLDGRWSVDATHRWHVLDRGDILEAYPLDVETPASSATLEAAPRVIDLQRTGARLAGTISQRFMHDGATCVARQPVQVRGCSAKGVEVAVPVLSAPTGWTPCAFAAGTTVVEVWKRP